MAPVPPTPHPRYWVGDQLLQHCALALQSLNTPHTLTTSMRRDGFARNRVAKHARVNKPRHPAPKQRGLATPLHGPGPSSHPTSTATLSRGRTRRGIMATPVTASALAIDEFLAQEFPHGPPAPIRGSKTPSFTSNNPAARTTTTRSSNSIVRLYELIQGLGLSQPAFTFSGVGLGWQGSVVLPGLGSGGNGAEDVRLELEAGIMCRSKQEVKESLAGQAVEIIESLQKEGKVGKKTKKGRRGNGVAATESSNASANSTDAKDAGVNYIGLLLEYQNSIRGPQPTYTEITLGTYHACEVHIPGVDQAFGSRETLYATKKAARQAAAHAAVMYLEESGQWPSNFGGNIRMRKSKSKPTPPSARATTLANGDGLSESTSYAQQVAVLAVQLGLESPSWNIEASGVAPGYHSVSCTFRGAGAMEGPWGQVTDVYGKKRAKEESARLVVEMLREEREKRLQAVREMIGGGPVEAVGGRVEVQEDDDEDDDGGDDDFHDAQE